MMLTIVSGPHHRDHYCFREKTHCTIGRASDCDVRLSGFEKDSTISRHHCQLDIDPPQILVKDLGSCNGTYVNGLEVFPDGNAPEGNQISMQDSDVLTIGGTTLQIHVVECPGCNGISEEINEEEDIPVCPGVCFEGSERIVLSDGATVLWKD